MKIGEFSRRVNVSIDTLRYYMREGLLQPTRRGGQFDFSEADERDVAMILKMRDMDFSLREIRTLLTLRRFSNENDEFYRKKHLEALERQLAKLESAICLLSGKAELIEMECKEYRAPRPACHNLAGGLPLAALPLLSCPDCGTALIISEAQLTVRGVVSGKIGCDCGYTAEIQDGVLQTPHHPTTPYDQPDLERGLHLKMSEDVALLHQKTYETITDSLRLLSFEGMVCLETHINDAFYLYSHPEAISGASLLIITDKYREMLLLYKNYLDHMELPFEILYIADDSTNLPLKNKSVDIFIDCMSTTTHSLYSHSFLPGEMRRYLKESGVAVGNFVFFNPRSRTHANIGRKYPEWNPDAHTYSYLKNNLEQNFPYVYLRPVGTVQYTSCERYLYSCHVDGEDWNTAAYQAYLRKPPVSAQL